MMPRMLYLLASVALAAAVLAPSVPADPLARKPHVSITSTLERIRTSEGAQSRVYLLWNRKIRSRPIGHAFYICREGAYRVSVCLASFSLPLGRIVAAGEIHGFDRYTLTVVGGARCYRYVAPGLVRGIRLGPATHSLDFVVERVLNPPC